MLQDAIENQRAREMLTQMSIQQPSGDASQAPGGVVTSAVAVMVSIAPQGVVLAAITQPAAAAVALASKLRELSFKDDRLLKCCCRE